MTANDSAETGSKRRTTVGGLWPNAVISTLIDHDPFVERLTNNVLMRFTRPRGAWPRPGSRDTR